MDEGDQDCRIGVILVGDEELEICNEGLEYQDRMLELSQ